MGDRVAWSCATGRLEQVGAPQALYDAPANLFVAGFIGSPRMNLIDLPGHDATPVQRALWCAGCPPRADAQARRAGVRAEHLRVGALGTGVPATVVMAEHLGDVSVLHLRIDGISELLHAKVDASHAHLAAGASVGLLPVAESVLAFDGSGRRESADAGAARLAAGCWRRLPALRRPGLGGRRAAAARDPEAAAGLATGVERRIRCRRTARPEEVGPRHGLQPDGLVQPRAAVLLAVRARRTPWCEDGKLVITARKETRAAAGDWGGQHYTSARLLTRGLAEWTYGFFEIRARLPCGLGTWPAIWMLGVHGEWPANGELDIMEHIGRNPGRVMSTIHTPAGSGAHGVAAAS